MSSPPSLIAKELLDTFFASRAWMNFFPYIDIPESVIMQICASVSDIFLAEESVLALEAPIIVCGDTHGQFTDTLRIFDVSGPIENTKYLFLGDYVDRGPQSIENLLFLLTMKVAYPNQIFLLRGNHESEEISTVYGLRDECVRRYSFRLYSVLINLFDTMPFAATINNTIFCVHGGISSSKCDLSTLRAIQRPLDITNSNVVTDLLWSDPSSEVNGFEPSPRGVSSLFGKAKCEQFLKDNNLSLIVRSHEYCPDGVMFPFGKLGGILTIFSAANYCNTLNSSSVIKIDEKLEIHFTVFQIINE